MMKKTSLSILLLLIAFYSCIEIVKPYSKLPPGIWHAEISIDNEHSIPFNFEIGYDDQDQIEMNILNGTEKIKVDHVDFGRNKKLLDTVYIDFPLMDSHIKAIYKENVLEGFWTVRNRLDYEMPFVAYYGQSFRFTTNSILPVMDISGTWQAIFEIETPDEYPAVGEFKAEGNYVEGTFLTETGDYRYLQGEVQGDQLFLSCFDGSHAFLFEAKINDDASLLGKFYSGNHYQTNWVARKDENATLTDAYDLTKVNEPDKKLDFSLVNSEGEFISINDSQYENKAKLVLLMGTWCPNCLDESKFILEYLDKNAPENLEVIAIAFERHIEKEKALSTIKNYKERLKIPYEVLYGGYFEKDEATANFQFLDKIRSYPTLLFVDRNNIVTKVHTGFAGPATSKYQEFIDEFDHEVKAITSKI
jgi:thiol-disulfide isomerase/thioredoxin